MDVAEPRPRHRGFVDIHTDPGLDLEGESESAEGVTVRGQMARPKLRPHIAVTSSRTPQPIRRGSPRHTDTSSSDAPLGRAAVKSAIGTGIRQRSHSPR